jgi:hypothetical protein
MLLRKFDYTVDPTAHVVSAGTAADTFLAKQCPVLVGALREQAERTSSAKLYSMNTRARNDAKAGILLAALFGFKKVSDIPDESVRQHVAEAGLIMAVTTSEIARRYLNNTLEPELHAGDEASNEWAAAHEEENGGDIGPTESQPAVVNGASDGIV